jgi:hypothetical protein
MMMLNSGPEFCVPVLVWFCATAEIQGKLINRMLKYH